MYKRLSISIDSNQDEVLFHLQSTNNKNTANLKQLLQSEHVFVGTHSWIVKVHHRKQDFITRSKLLTQHRNFLIKFWIIFVNWSVNASIAAFSMSDCYGQILIRILGSTRFLVDFVIWIEEVALNCWHSPIVHSCLQCHDRRSIKYVNCKCDFFALILRKLRQYVNISSLRMKFNFIVNFYPLTVQVCFCRPVRIINNLIYIKN